MTHNHKWKHALRIFCKFNKNQKGKSLVRETILSHNSALSKSSFSRNHSLKSSWFSVHRLCKPGFGQFIPFFQADPLKVHQTGCEASVSCHLRPLHRCSTGLSRTVRHLPRSHCDICFGLMLGVVLVPRAETMSQFQALLQVFFMNRHLSFLVFCPVSTSLLLRRSSLWDVVPSLRTTSEALLESPLGSWSSPGCSGRPPSPGGSKLLPF